MHTGMTLARLLSDFINLTQVHNFTVSAQDSFTFRRLSVFTVSFTGILQLLVLMQIIKRFVPSLVMIQNLQPKGREFESTCLCVVVFYLYSICLISFL